MFVLTGARVIIYSLDYAGKLKEIKFKNAIITLIIGKVRRTDIKLFIEVNIFFK